ncbi:thiopeptide-type bacteriocin biosynthesis protein [Streptosporangium sp. LJ11]|uniref:thiopeptide-type bacteriocin biosynthesis protein n=1 Tax=Streptosporangium sp. LJ11 TaxID=3436927 RepID=UPI003F792795
MTTTTNIENVGAHMAEEWRSLRVSVPPDGIERLLTTVVDTWATGASAAGEIDGWYFERPGEDGTDLRLHLRDAAGHAMDELRARAETFANGFPGAVVEECDRELDASRFGGDDGVAACMAHFAASSALAVETFRETTSRATRLLAAGGFLLASARAMGADWRAAVGWLRGYARGRAPATEAARARDTAETAYFRDEATWQHHHDRVRAEISSPGTTAGFWHLRQCGIWSELRRLRQMGRLDASPEAVFHELAHATNNRLGLCPEEEVQVAWLWSMALVAPGPRLPFFADTVESVDRQLHEQSKYFPARLPVQVPDITAKVSTGRQDMGTPEEVVRLPEPSAPDGPARGFEEVLLARRSAYGRYRGPLTVAELSTLLYFSAAETADKTLPGAESSYRVRPYPSGGTRYPLRLLAYCHDVEGLPRGTYLYDPAEHALGRLSDRDISADLMRMAPATDPRIPTPPKAGGNIDAGECPLWIMMVADLTYQRLHYGLRSYRLVMQESGHLGQNLSLVATWLGKGCVGLGGFYDDTVNQVLGLDGVASSVVYVYVFGTIE